MEKMLWIFFVIMSVGSSTVSAKEDLALIHRGKSDHTIVISSTAPVPELHAARELQRFLFEMSGAMLPITTDAFPEPQKAILIGENKFTTTLLPEIDFKDLGKEGYVLRTIGDSLVLAGGKPRGTLYAVYGLLEDHLDCRWFTPDCSRIPKRKTITLPQLDERITPALEYRDPFYSDVFDGDWTLRNRMNSSQAKDVDYKGGKVSISKKAFCHTFYPLVPPAKYFKEHPEYFSEIGGKRMESGGQLCLTNPDALRIAIEQLKIWIKDEPGADIFSVSQNDWFGNCQCANCRAVDEREGSPAGSLMEFVNAVADGIAKDFPNITVETLAYQYTRKPPKTVKPRPNVVIRLCSIECCFGHPLETDDYPQTVSFRDDIIGWGKLTNRLYIWDYVTDFGHYVMPFPNLRILQPNIRFFIKNSVTGIFEEGNYSPGGHGEMAALRSYLMAKFLWNPDYDYDKALTEFLEGYYGKTSHEIREYIDLLHDRFEETKGHLTIGAPPTEKYLDDETLDKASQLFDQAERRVARNPILLQRVRDARLPIQYVRLATKKGSSENPYAIRGDKYAPLTKEDPIALKFTQTALAAGITQIREGGHLQTFLNQIAQRQFKTFDVFKAKTAQSEMQLIGGLGGRVLSWKNAKTKWNALAEGDPDSDLYPLDGGYSESFEAQAGFQDNTGYTVSSVPGGFGLTAKTSSKQSLDVKRTILLEEDTLKILTDLSSGAKDEPSPITPRSISSWNMGAAEDLILWLPKAASPYCASLKEATKTLLVFDSAEYGTEWLLWNSKEGRGVRARLPQEASKILFKLDTKRGVVQVTESVACRTLSKGDSLSLDRQYTLLTTKPEGLPKEAESALPQPRAFVEFGPDSFSLYRLGELCQIVSDSSASKGVCVSMPGHTREWAVQVHFDTDTLEAGASYQVTVRVKVVKKGNEGTAFRTGLWNSAKGHGIADISVFAKDVGDAWQDFIVAKTPITRGVYFWIAPEANPENITEVRVEKVTVRKVQ